MVICIFNASFKVFHGEDLKQVIIFFFHREAHRLPGSGQLLTPVKVSSPEPNQVMVGRLLPIKLETADC